MPVAFLTGSSRGIGLATARALLGAGWTVVGTARGRKDLAALEALGVEAVALDVTDEPAAEAAVHALVARHGRLDALIANAGVGLFGCFEDVAPEQARALFDVNFFGVLCVARAALPHLRASRGRLVVISSIAGRRSAPGSSLYNASKFALEGWGEALRFELAPFGVPVVLIEPGPTRSDFAGSVWQATRAGVGPYAAFTEALRARRAAAMGDPAPAEVVADAVLAALRARRPPFRVPTGAGTAAQILAARLLPWPAYEALVRWKLGLNKGM